MLPGVSYSGSWAPAVSRERPSIGDLVAEFLQHGFSIWVFGMMVYPEEPSPLYNSSIDFLVSATGDATKQTSAPGSTVAKNMLDPALRWSEVGFKKAWWVWALAMAIFWWLCGLRSSSVWNFVPGNEAEVCGEIPAAQPQQQFFPGQIHGLSPRGHQSLDTAKPEPAALPTATAGHWMERTVDPKTWGRD